MKPAGRDRPAEDEIEKRFVLSRVQVAIQFVGHDETVMMLAEEWTVLESPKRTKQVTR